MRRDGETTPERSRAYRGASRLALYGALLAVKVTVTAGSLHETIDREIDAAPGGAFAEPCDDATFLRRVHLDLGGIIPTAAGTRAFLLDRSPDKRRHVIDSLLASEDFTRHFAETLSLWLLDRRTDTTMPVDEWTEFLRRSISSGKPWDRLVREILAADGREPSTRGAIKLFLVNGRNDHHQLAQDVARVFLGRSILCSRCHDHPTIDDYTQADYYGLLAYLRQGFVHRNGKDGKSYYLERTPGGEVEFQSVFEAYKHTTGPRLRGAEPISVPRYEKGEELAEPAKDGFPGTPRFRPRALLARDLASAENESFVLNSVNRLWALLMGRGLVHPIDLVHADNAPSHPGLLDALAGGFVERRFDIKWLLREICLSDAYQRSSRLPDHVDPDEVAADGYRVAALRPLSAEQMARSLLRATGNLSRIEKAQGPETTRFLFKDYINGRITEPPDNLPDVLSLFASVFGSPPGVPEMGFNPSTEHALFLRNERLLQSWLEPRDGNLIASLMDLDEPETIAQRLWLSVLSRTPEAEESQLVKDLVDGTANRDAALRDLAASLLMSAEFRLNH